MQIRSTKRDSTFYRLSEDPSTDVVIGSSGEPPQGLVLKALEPPDKNINFLKLDTEALGRHEKLVGKKIKFADLGVSTLEQGLLLSKLNLPEGTDTVFALTGVVLSCADTYHALNKENRDAMEITISTAKTVTAVTDLIAPFIPVLSNYQPHLKFVTLLLKTVGAGKEVFELTYKSEK